MKLVAVESDAEERLKRLAVLVLEAAEPGFDLFDDLLGAGGVGLGSDAVAGDDQ
jgi:hypothetical protein